MSLGNLEIAIKLRLDNKEMEGNLAISRDQLRKFAADMKAAGDAGAGAFSRTRTALKSISDQLAQARNALLSYVSLMQAASAARAIIDAADAMRAMSARLKIATADAQDYARAQAGVFEIANRYGSSVDDTARAFARLNPVIRQLGGGSSETLRMLDGLAASLKLSGATAQEASSVLLQFSQAMGSGKIGGDELRAMMEAAEPLMRAVAAQMGKTTGELRMMAEQGQLTSAAFGNALLPAIEKLNGQAEQVPLGLGQSMRVLRNELSKAFGREFEGQATALSAAVRDLASHADTAARAVRVLTDALVIMGQAVAAAFAGAAIGGFAAAMSRAASAVTAVRSALAGVNTVMLGIAAGAAMQKLERLSTMGKGGLLGLVFFGVYELTDWLLEVTKLREAVNDLLEPVFRAIDRLRGIDRTAEAKAAAESAARMAQASQAAQAGQPPKRLSDPAAFARLTQDLAYETRLRAKHKQELLDLEQAYQDKLASLKTDAERRAFRAEYAQARRALLERQRGELESMPTVKNAAEIAQARAAAAKDAADAELAILKDGLQRQKTALEAALEDRIVSIRAYYAEKTRIEQAEVDAEIARQRALLAEQQRLSVSGRTEADRIKARGEVMKLEAELIVLNHRRADIEQANARAAAKAERELADALAAAREELARITGTATDADRRAAIERGHRELRARLAFCGVGAAPVLARNAAAALEGQTFSPATVAAAQAALDEDLAPDGDLHGTAAVKMHWARVLLGRAVAQLAQDGA